jgi:hypothetical protein
MVELAAGTRKTPLRYSQLCGKASDAVDAVRSAIPTGFTFARLVYENTQLNVVVSPLEQI